MMTEIQHALGQTSLSSLPDNIRAKIFELCFITHQNVVYNLSLQCQLLDFDYFIHPIKLFWNLHCLYIMYALDMLAFDHQRFPIIVCKIPSVNCAENASIENLD